jgi:hypothetical protein
VDPVFRLSIDEVGHANIKDAENENCRYLSLTGVIMGIGHERLQFEPALNILKMRIFGTADVVLHRNDIVYRRPPFDCLNDTVTRVDFDNSVRTLMQNASYRVITVTIDKLEHKRRYLVWQAHPYHYCLMALLERYVLWLIKANSCGDVMAESRGKKDNRKLERSYARLYDQGTPFVGYKMFQRRLTSRELKIKDKAANIAALQLADLIANPSMRSMICEKDGVPMTAGFGNQVVTILKRNKYRRMANGTITGVGTKWLP